MNRFVTATCALAGLATLTALTAVSNSQGVRSPQALVPLMDTSPLKYPVAACYTEDVEQELFEAIETRLRALWQNGEEEGGGRYNRVARWQAGGGVGNPITIAFSFPPDGINIPNGVGEGSGPNILNQRFAVLFGSVEAGKDKVRAAFQGWANLTGISYVEVSDDGAPFPGSAGPINGGSGRGDVRIAMKTFGFQGVLAYNFFPQGGDMVLNNNHGGDFRSSAANFRFIRNVVAHEHGHGNGFAHVCPANRTKLLEPFIFTTRDMLQHDDIRGGQRNYGDPDENNDNAATATDLGFISNIHNRTNRSTDTRTDDDYYRFEVAAGKQVTIRADPVGLTYQDFDQLQNGQCANSGPTINSRIIHDLRLVLYESNGSTVLLSQDVSGIGVAETITDFILPGGGEFVVRVDTGTNNTESQLYSFRIDVADAPGSQAATLTDVTRTLGIFVSGGVPELLTSNNQYYVLQSGPGFDPNEPHPARMDCGFDTGGFAASTLDVAVEEKANIGGPTAVVLLRNWNSGQFDEIGRQGLNTNDQTFNFNGIAAGNYINGANRLEVRVRTFAVLILNPSIRGIFSHDLVGVDMQ